MTVKDIGPKPQTFDLEKETVDNPNYRTVAWTGKYLQLTLMSIPVGGDIGLEVHPETDQFMRIDAGQGKAVMGDSADDLDFTQEVSDGWSVQVPAGLWHDIENTGEDDLKLYVVYAPVHHAAGIVQHRPAAHAGIDAAGVVDQGVVAAFNQTVEIALDHRKRHIVGVAHRVDAIPLGERLRQRSKA